ncbi:hypothetical protein FOMA001_g9188 [Fusarium oxysporum f. sp. matthiolae]|nr:hypothetical protein FOMA001_g9188 [Fusarium oxysporum f. sp. matthiolae]
MQPNYQVAPDGTRMWLLHIGNAVVDEAVFLPFVSPPFPRSQTITQMT